MNKNIKSTILLSFLLLVGQSNAAQLNIMHNVSRVRTVLAATSVAVAVAIPRLMQWHKQRQLKAQELLLTYAPITMPILQATVLKDHAHMPEPLLGLITDYCQKIENPTFAELHKETGGRIALPVEGDTLTVKSSIKGVLYTVKITHSLRWEDIHNQIHNDEGIPADQQRFFRGGRELQCLEDLGDWKNSGPLTLILRLHRANNS
jgi:hypothetical protein